MHTRRLMTGAIVALLTMPATGLAQAPAPAQGAVPADPIAGNWRGTIRSAQGTESAFILTITKEGDRYGGTATGLGGLGEAPLKNVSATGNKVSFESSADSKLGQVTLKGELTIDANAAAGTGSIGVGPQQFDATLKLQRRMRREVTQPQVQQSADYFVGQWKFEYLGGEYPPLSLGSRSGTVTFSKVGASNFVTGKVDGEAGGKKYQETLSIGFDPESRSLAFLERRSDGVELTSVVNWQSPLAMTFVTSPVTSNGRTYQLRRVIAVTNDGAFSVTEEFSIDGGSFRRLGNATFTKTIGRR